MLLVGVGGLYAEVLADVAVALAPVSADEAEGLIRSLRAAPFVGVVLCVNPGCHCGLPECACAGDEAYRHQWTEEQWWLRLGADDLADVDAILDARFVR